MEPAIGVDEAGRGPLAGPLVVAAVWLRPDRVPVGLDDSKRLTEARREALFDLIVADHPHVILEVPVEVIDARNILRATLEAMAEVVERLRHQLGEEHPAIVDGNQLPPGLAHVRAEVKGDARFPQVSAASILAKVARDRRMVELDGIYPGYGFRRHKGYGSADHLEAIRRLGPSPAHRRSFAPVREMLAQPSLIR